MLEDMQLNVARSVTGAKRRTSHQFIYNETKWPKLSEMRQDCKKIFMFKVVNNLVPPYLCDILPWIIQDSVDHDLMHNFGYLDAKTERHNNSLFPSIVQMWNVLSNELRNLTTINEFRRRAIPRLELNSLSFGFSRQLEILCMCSSGCSVVI